MDARVSPKNKVLRTIYLDPQVDEKLRQIGFEQRRSKNDLVRIAVDALLRHYRSDRDLNLLSISKKSKS